MCDAALADMDTARESQLNALDLLVEQHDELEGLIQRLQEEELDEQQRLFVFFELADKLAAHAVTEEELFYPAVLAQQTDEVLLESAEEHLAMKRVLADMLVTELDDPRFDTQLSVLAKELEHHARQQEEHELFPKLRALMTGEELHALGGAMLVLFESLLAVQPRKQVRMRTSKPAEL